MKLNMIAAAALAFLQQGGNQAALDAAAPHETFSPRQRRKVVNFARSQMKTLSPTQQAINKLTNWQRNQWGRAGHPMDEASLKRFAEMPHHKKMDKQQFIDHCLTTQRLARGAA